MQVIDEYVHRLKDRGYAALIALGARGFTFATNIVLSTAVKVISIDFTYSK